MRRLLTTMALISSACLMAGCGQNEYQDLQKFMADAQAKKGGQIEPLPAFTPYKSYIYSAAGLRSPFETPSRASTEEASGQKTAAPNTNRPREFLERFNIASFKMVGTVQDKNGVMWGLLDDGQGSVHRATVGNYIGKNYGRIVQVTLTSIDVIETVTDGQGGWIERPRTLKMN